MFTAEKLQVFLLLIDIIRNILSRRQIQTSDFALGLDFPIITNEKHNVVVYFSNVSI